MKYSTWFFQKIDQNHELIVHAFLIKTMNYSQYFFLKIDQNYEL